MLACCNTSIRIRLWTSSNAHRGGWRVLFLVDRGSVPINKLPGKCVSSILGLQPFKRRPFPIKTGVIWVLGNYSDWRHPDEWTETWNDKNMKWHGICHNGWVICFFFPRVVFRIKKMILRVGAAGRSRLSSTDQNRIVEIITQLMRVVRFQLTSWDFPTIGNSDAQQWYFLDESSCFLSNLLGMWDRTCSMYVVWCIYAVISWLLELLLVSFFNSSE